MPSPATQKNDISPALLGRLLKAAPNIVGIKSSNDDVNRFQEYVQVAKEVAPEGFVPCFGVDELMLGGLVFGSKAQISGNSNSYPEPFVQLYDAYMAGDLQRAQQLQQVVNQVIALHQGGRTTAFFQGHSGTPWRYGGPCASPHVRVDHARNGGGEAGSRTFRDGIE